MTPKINPFRHTLLVSSLFLTTALATAQTIVTTDSKLASVTVYSQGASMQHTTPTTSIPKGNSELVINQIARQVNTESIRVLSSNKNIKIRSEEHTSELQSRFDIVCRPL